MRKVSSKRRAEKYAKQEDSAYRNGQTEKRSFGSPKMHTGIMQGMVSPVGSGQATHVMRACQHKRITLMAVMIACACMLVFMLSGCGNNAENNQDTTSQADEKKTLTVAMELAYPPFETKDDAGNPEGLAVDFIRDFGDAYNYDIQIENTAWDGLIPSLQSGKADLVISSMTITPERAESVDFSDAYAMAQLAILANADSNITNVDDLNQAGKKVAVKTGSTGDVYATKNLTNADIVRLADESACVTEVVQGKADGFLYDQLTIYRNQKANPDTTQAVYIPFQDAEEWGIAVRKGNTELLDQLNEFIAQSKTDGEFDTLTEKYLSEEKKAFDEYNFKWFFDFE